MLRRSIVANVLGMGWLAILSLVVTPLQIRILGVEAYGLLAFIAAVQVFLNVFDLGCSTTITREVASDLSPEWRRSRELVEGLVGWYWAIGALLGAALLLGSAWLARHWLALDGSAADVATLAIRLAAVTVVAHWPVSFYSGVIAGRQRFDLLNLLSAATATTGQLGGAAVILATGSVTALLAWKALTAAVEVVAYMGVSRRVLPGLRWRPRFALSAVHAVWRFALGTHLLIISSLILTQADRFVVSKLLSIGALGYYSLAYTTAFALPLLQSTITSATFPAFAADARAVRVDALAERCAKATQLTGYVLSAVGFVLIFFGHDVLRVWVGAEAATAAYPVLRLLVFGFVLGMPLGVLVSLAVAAGEVRLPRRANAVALALYLPVLYVSTRRFSTSGTALAWVLLQGFFLAALAPPTLRLLGERRVLWWLGRHFGLFVLMAATVFGMARLAASGAGGGLVLTALTVGLAGVVYLGLAFLALHREMRADAGRHVARAYLLLRGVVGLQRTH